MILNNDFNKRIKNNYKFCKKIKFHKIQTLPIIIKKLKINNNSLYKMQMRKLPTFSE